jgi:O-antigen ligase
VLARAIPAQPLHRAALGALVVALAASILLLPTVLVLWLVAGTGAVALALLWPFVALVLLPCAIAFGSLVSFSVAGVNIGPTDLLVGTLALAQGLRNWRRFRGLPTMLPLLHPHQLGRWLRARWLADRARLLVYVALAAYLLVVCLSLLVASDRIAAVKEIIKWSEVLVVAVLAVIHMRTERHVRAILWATITAAVAQALLGYGQWIAATGEAGPGGALLRVFGTFSQPNPYAGFLNFGLLLALALVVFGRETRERWLAAGASVLLIVAQALAGSRGALFGLGVGVAVMMVVGWRRERVAGLAVAVVLPLVIILWIARTLPTSVQRLVLDQLRINDALSGTVTSANFSTVERLAHWIAGLRMVVAHPVLGVGAGNYDAAYARYALPDWPDALGHAHNYYINAAAETGAPGGVVFLALTAATIYLGWYSVRQTRQFAREHSELHALALGFLATVVALAVHNLTDDLFVHAMGLQFALTLAGQVALIRLTRFRGAPT